MKLYDKYSLKASIYDKYSDDVLDFLTLYIDYGLKLFKIKNKRPPKNVEAMLAANGIIYAKNITVSNFHRWRVLPPISRTN